MKALAILKDSLREALDSKVFYFLLALSALVILVVASVGYTMMTAQGELEAIADQWNWINGLQTQNRSIGRYVLKVAEVRQTNDAPEPWNGVYEFRLTLDCPDAEKARHAAEVLRGSLPPLFPGEGNEPRDEVELLRLMLRQRLVWMANPRLEASASADDPKQVVLQGRCDGTLVKERRGWMCEPTVLFGAFRISFWHPPLGAVVQFILDGLVGSFGASIATLLGVVVTAYYVPNMLRKGTVDLLLTKPVSRPVLLLYKYLGGLLFFLLNTVVIVVGVWLAIGLRAGLWSTGFLLTVLVMTFQFAVFYALSALFGVLTRSPMVSILMCGLLWAVFFGVWLAHAQLHPAGAEELELQPTPHWAVSVVDVAYRALPRMDELNSIRATLIRNDVLPREAIKQPDFLEAREPAYDWKKLPETLGVSLAFIAVLLGLACWRFSASDY
jgi:ABC-type transport system involved in multi-copper enzyme maturation permease subunit